MSEMDERLARFQRLQRFQKLQDLSGLPQTEERANEFVEHLPETVGTVVGGAAGALTPIPGGAAMGASGGAATANLIKQYIQTKLGSRQEIDPSDAAMEAGKVLAAELAMKGLARVPVGGGKDLGNVGSQVIEKLIQGGKHVTARASGWLSGAGKDASLQAIEDPSGVLSGSDYLDTKAARAGEALMNAKDEHGAAIEAARDKSVDQYGDVDLNTGELFGDVKNLIKRYTPNSRGRGRLSMGEHGDLKDIVREDLLTPVDLPPGQVAEGAVDHHFTGEEIPNLDPAIRYQPVKTEITKSGNLDRGKVVIPEINTQLYSRQSVPSSTPSGEVVVPSVKTQLFERQTIPAKNPYSSRVVTSPEISMTPVEPEIKYLKGKHGGEQLVKDPIYGDTYLPDVSAQVYEPKLSMQPARGSSSREFLNMSSREGTGPETFDILQPEVAHNKFETQWKPSGRPQSTPEVRANPLNFEWQPSGDPQMVTPEVRANPVASKVVKDGKLATVREAAPGSELTGSRSYLPTKKFKDIRDLVDWLDNQIGQAEWNNSAQATPKSTSFLRSLKLMRGRAKELMHGVDGELGFADAGFKRDAKDLSLLNPLTKEESREAFIKDIFKGRKQSVVDAAERQLPSDVQRDIKNAAADNAFDVSLTQGNSLKPTPRTVMRLGLTGLGVGAGSITGVAPVAAMLGAGIAGATSPTLHKFALTRGSQLMGPLVRPALEQALPASLYAGSKLSPWTLLKKQENKDGKDER
jgi:hypothetical protein